MNCPKKTLRVGKLHKPRGTVRIESPLITFSHLQLLNDEVDHHQGAKVPKETGPIAEELIDTYLLSSLSTKEQGQDG